MVKLYETQSAPASPSSRSRFRFEPLNTSFDDLDLPQTPPSPTTEPVFCCSIHNPALKQDGFQDFLQAPCVGVVHPPFNGSVRSIGPDCKHVIVVAPTSKKPTTPNTPKKPTRYFAFLESVEQYQEIDSILHTYLTETSEFEETTTEAKFTCTLHRQGYKVVRQDRVVPEDSDTNDDDDVFVYRPWAVPSPPSPKTAGFGKSRPVLSPSQLSMEKRKFMIKMLSYGRKDQLQEIIKRTTIEEQDKTYQESFDEGLSEQEKEKKLEEKLEYEIKHALAPMRLFFVAGKTC